MASRFLPQFFLYGGAGAIGTAAHFAILAALVQFADAGAVAASTVGAIVGAIVNYTLNYRFTFASRRDASRGAAALPRRCRRRDSAERGRAGRDARLRPAALSRRPGRRDRRGARRRVPRESQMDVLSAGSATARRDRRRATLAVGRRARVQRGGGAARLPSPARRACWTDSPPTRRSSTSTTAAATARWRCSPSSTARDARVAVIDLSRNFGKEVAMSAGLDAANGDAVVVIDADLQDPPELIPDMVRAWREGSDVVLMRRSEPRAGVAGSRRRPRASFYRAMGSIGTIDIPENVGDFRLLSRRAAAALRRFPERTPLHEGAVRVDRFPVHGNRIRSRRPLRRHDQVELLAAVEFRARGHHVVLGRAAQARELRRAADRARRVRLRRQGDRQDAAVRRPGRGLSDAGRARAVPRRPAADGARHHRRVPGAHVHRGQAAPALPRPAAPALGAADRGAGRIAAAARPSR